MAGSRPSSRAPFPPTSSRGPSARAWPHSFGGVAGWRRSFCGRTDPTREARARGRAHGAAPAATACPPRGGARGRAAGDARGGRGGPPRARGARPAAEGGGRGEFRRALEELGTTYLKLGQLLSSRPDLLPDVYIEELGKLVDEVPPFPFAEVERIAQEDLV